MNPEYVPGDRVHEELPCILSDDEIRESARTLADKRKKQREVERKKKLAMADLNTRLGELNDDIDNLAETIKSGKEHRAVECEWRFYPNQARAALVRLDTAEEVRTRAMTARELDRHTPGSSDDDQVDGKSAAAGERTDEAPADDKPAGKKKRKSKKEKAAEAEAAAEEKSAAEAEAANAEYEGEPCSFPGCKKLEHDGPHELGDGATVTEGAPADEEF